MIVGPLIMIILKLPMILVPLFLKCLQTEKQIYIALISYILALLPVILTFPMFILPSYMYYKIFIEKRNKLFGISRRQDKRDGFTDDTIWGSGWVLDSSLTFTHIES